MPTIWSFAAVALGGALGAVARYGVALVVARWWPSPLPWATLLVNLLGCLLIGLALPLFGRTTTSTLQLLVVVGFVGSFTTFSTFSLETILLWQGPLPLAAVLYVLGSVAAGVTCVVAGVRLAQWLL